MESANLQPHHKTQEQFDKYSPLETQTAHDWNPNFFMNNNGSKYSKNLTDLWPSPLIRTSMNNHNSFYPNIKDEMSKLSELIYCPSNGSEAPILPSKRNHGNLWHNNLSIANHMTASGDNLYTNSFEFNHIFPSTTLFSTSLDLNLKALNHLSSTYDTESCNQSLLGGKLSTSDIMGKHHIRERSHSPSTTFKMSAYVSGSTTSTKRAADSFSETKESQPVANKKHRSSISRSPCPTLKVRKEKLGDRVAALQKLVAPFGKTDTASVLTEAIGYIQFLHDQVETLSVPFMKSSQKSKLTTMQMAQMKEEGKEEHKSDLRSRGLCLLPHSYIIFH